VTVTAMEVVPGRTRHGVLTVSGYGLRIAVERGHLVVEDGVADERRSMRFSRVGADLRRLVVLGHTGTVSLDALRWLQDVGCAFVHLDTGGSVFSLIGARGRNDARLRRTQASAREMPVGLDIARALIGAKLEGQAMVLERSLHAPDAARMLRAALPYVERAESLDAVRVLEWQAATVYWRHWRTVPVRFAGKALPRVPRHWQSFGIRRSILSGRNQRAINPPNAMLNYLNAIGEAEARLALVREGLDPGLGIVHADSPDRDSLALDVLETIRPQIEAFVLATLARDTYARDDFFELRDGGCRLMPPLTERFAETSTRWAEAIAPVAGHVARLLDRAGAAGQRPNPVNSGASPKAVVPRGLFRRLRPSEGTEQRYDKNWRPPKARRCRKCGNAFEHSKNVYCEACIPSLPALAAEEALKAVKVRKGSGQAAVSAETRSKLARARTERAKAVRAWEAAHPSRPNKQVFATTIWPLLQGVDARRVRDATGLSTQFARYVLRGKQVPHPMHWDVIARLTRERIK